MTPTSPGVLRVKMRSAQIREAKERKAGQHLVTFFPLNVYINSVALGGLQRSVCLWQQTSVNPIKPRLPLMQLTLLPTPSSPTTTSPETELEAWEKDGRPLPPTVLPPASSTGRWGKKACVPQQPPPSPGVCPSPPASISFEDLEEAKVKHRRMHWKECSYLKWN